MQKKRLNIEHIIAKVNTSKSLTRREEIFYMLKVLKIPEKQVNIILAINDNKNPNLIID